MTMSSASWLGICVLQSFFLGSFSDAQVAGDSASTRRRPPQSAAARLSLRFPVFNGRFGLIQPRLFSPPCFPGRGDAQTVYPRSAIPAASQNVQRYACGGCYFCPGVRDCRRHNEPRSADRCARNVRPLPYRNKVPSRRPDLCPFDDRRITEGIHCKVCPPTEKCSSGCRGEKKKGQG